MDPSGLREWLAEAAANPLLILIGIIVIRVMIFQHNQNRASLYDLGKKMEHLEKATHDVSVNLRANGDRIVAAIERAGTTVRARRIVHDDDTQ